MKRGVSRRAISRAVVIKCIDCEIVMGVESGEIPETVVRWAICTRCVARRNGMAGAKTPQDLGIY